VETVDRKYIKQYLKVGHYIGSGVHGEVYKSNPRTVFKVTYEYDEALFNAWLYGMRSRFNCFPKVYEVFQVPSGQWAIWREDIHNMKESEVSIWSDAGGYEMVERKRSWNPRLQLGMNREPKAEMLFSNFVNTCSRVSKKYKFKLSDPHSENVGIRKIGPWRKAVLRDLSCCQLPKGRRTWAKRFIIGIEKE